MPDVRSYVGDMEIDDVRCPEDVTPFLINRIVSLQTGSVLRREVVAGLFKVIRVIAVCQVLHIRDCVSLIGKDRSSN